MKIFVEIQRFNPESDTEHYTQKYEVDAEPADRLLTVLLDIKGTQDPTLGIRRSCAHGVCGSDAMIINGKERLACKTLIQDVAQAEGAVIQVEPLRNLPIQRDLMVDQHKFFENYMHVKPYFISSKEPKEKEFRQTADERQKFEEGTKCILLFGLPSHPGSQSQFFRSCRCCPGR